MDAPESQTYYPRDPETFFAELEELTQRVYADRKPEDVTHLRRIQRWGIFSSLVGYATAWMGLNPLSVFGMALGISCRWTIAHHVLHRGYDGYPNAREGERSDIFGRGLRRWLDWCDWMPIKAWVHEHNGLHHYRLGENYDPDVPEVNLRWITGQHLPMFVRYFVVVLSSLTWKWTYYGPRLLQVSLRERGTAPQPYRPWLTTTWNPMNAIGRRVWLESWMPYVFVRFGLVPLLFLPLGRTAWIAVLLNTLLAELVTSIHSFFLIVPNHAGADIPQFATPPQDKNEFRLRQIVGSVNFRTGSDLNDFLHGWLNYQIEHHVWPDLSLRQYQTWQPHLKTLCERHQVAYCQENIWVRSHAMVKNVVGRSRMQVLPTLAVGAA
jgi:fatty acid desaturase